MLKKACPDNIHKLGLDLTRLCVFDFSSCGFHASDAEISRRGFRFVASPEGVFGRVPNLIIFSLVGCLVMIGLIFRSVIWLEVVCRSSNGSLKRILSTQKRLQKADGPTVDQVDYGLSNSNILYLLLDSSSFIDSTRLLVTVDNIRILVYCISVKG